MIWNMGEHRKSHTQLEDDRTTAREILNPMGGLSVINERDRPVEQNGYQKTGVAPSTWPQNNKSFWKFGQIAQMYFLMSKFKN